ncbi:MAG: 3-phosphoshikimate 1-carboxyvinyltransferase [Nitrospirae bacterium RBG_16_64_22]|nr:MAG: 3-phosphoshikimate 1-carboxyvinyltransferase [Nitrospirae bacterium RBG_16_64_22]
MTTAGPTRFVLSPARRLEGEIVVPGDKSISHRAVILGAIAHGTTEIRGLLRGDDVLRTLAAFRRLGVSIRDEGDVVRIDGRGLAGLREPDDVIDLGNSGTSIRLLAGLLAGRPFLSILTGDESLRGRPMGRIADPLKKMGARIDGRDGGNLAPLAVRGGGLSGISYVSPVASAQVKSAVLLAGLSAEGETSVTEPGLSRDHTEKMLTAFGASVRREGLKVSVGGFDRLAACSVDVPGDFSSAAFFIVGATILPGSDLTIRRVGVNPTRTGLIDVLRNMGGRIELENMKETGGEAVADIRVRSAPLTGVTVAPEIVPRMIDEFPVLCIAAAAAEGETAVTGASELRVKESDRIAAMAHVLGQFGVQAEDAPDGIRIHGLGGSLGGDASGRRIHSHGDHRVAMSAAIAALAAPSETLVEDTACVATSFPGFLGLLESSARP